jgi:hypothetical protein
MREERVRGKIFPQGRDSQYGLSRGVGFASIEPMNQVMPLEFILCSVL